MSALKAVRRWWWRMQEPRAVDYLLPRDIRRMPEPRNSEHAAALFRSFLRAVDAWLAREPGKEEAMPDAKPTRGAPMGKRRERIDAVSEGTCACGSYLLGESGTVVVGNEASDTIEHRRGACIVYSPTNGTTLRALARTAAQEGAGE